MTIKELMIGDYVYYTEFDRKEVCKVKGIEADRVMLEEAKTPYTPITYIKPIPLATAESAIISNRNVREVSIQLKYVHELQHLLRLCGVIDEIEL